jgi:formylglycine-generating enzyme required for sulfatase activity
MGNLTTEGNPRRIVRISSAFFMSTYEITWRQLFEILDPAETYRSYEGTREAVAARNQLEFPADVEWTLARKFCERLSSANGIKARLPTEAEWEYACRAGTTTLYGEWESIDDTKANVCRWQDRDGNVMHSDRRRRWFVAVGQYEGNRWGLHDMMGNADEWCLDTYSDGLDIGTLPQIDPVANIPGSVFRVVRGGRYSQAETVFARTGDAETASGRGVRLVVEVDDGMIAKCCTTKKVRE